MATLKFVQAQKFTLSGSGASIGDTTLTLQSMLGIDGVAITTTDIGTGGFGTIEPGNGSQEEAIKFTGITQNSNGTATLTGVSTVLFKSPYTATSGLAKTHAGATTFILSNDAAFYGAILDYVDNSLMASGIPMTTTAQGIAKISVAPTSAINPIVVGDNDPRVPTQSEKNYLSSAYITPVPYAVATGTSSAFTATLASSISTLASGSTLNILVPITNASGVTLNVNALGARTIKKGITSSLASGDIVVGQVASLVYDGNSFQLTSPPATSLTQISSGATTKDVSSTATTTIAHGLISAPRLVRLDGSLLAQTSAVGTSIAHSVYSNGTQSSIYIAQEVGAGTSKAEGITFRLYDNIGVAYTEATITVDATNISLAWSKTGSPTGTAHLIWQALV